MFEKRVAGLAGQAGESAHLGTTRTAAARKGEATHRQGTGTAGERDTGAGPDSAELVDRLIGLRAEAACRDAEMLALMVEFVSQRRVEDAGAGSSMSVGFAVDELALALVCTRHRVRQQLDLAQALRGELSATGKLLAAGVIDSYQAWVIFDMLSWLVEPEHVAQVEADILDRAADLTGGQLRARLARLITATEPDAFAVRHQRAMTNRRVSANTGGSDAALDGMGSLWLSHSAVDIAAIDAELTRLARASIQTHTSATAADADHDDGHASDGGGARPAGEDGRHSGGSFDNVRADVARDLLLGRHQFSGQPDGFDLTGELAGAPDAANQHSAADHAADTGQTGTGEPGTGEPGTGESGTGESGTALSAADPAAPPGCPNPPGRSSKTGGPGAQVVVVVPIQTLMGIDETPGQVLGYGPIPAAVARAVASGPDSVWRRMLTDPAGHLADLSTTSYRPGKVLDLAVTIRDGTSRFPRSNAPAVGADFDHTIPYPVGDTCYGNGGKLSRRDHRVKHAPGWKLTQGPEPGQFTWTTPTGHTYQAGPADQPAGSWPKPWQLDPDPPDLQQLMTQLARAPDYLDDQLLHELDIDPPDG